MVDVKYEPRALRSAAFALIAEGWNDMVQGGCTEDYVSVPPISATTELFYVCDGKDIVGCIAYDHDRSLKEITIQFAYVEPSSRRKGHFRMMLAQIKSIAGRNDVIRMAMEIGVGNQLADSVMKAIGAYPVSTTYIVGGGHVD